MPIPDFVKSFTFKDWMYFMGAVFSIVMAWAILHERVDELRNDARAAVIKQEQIDQRQDLLIKEAREEMRAEIRNQTSEIKQELRDLRNFIQQQKK